MRNWINIIVESASKGASFPFADHMSDACEFGEAGFHFEEGGCWGMALALYDFFMKIGETPQLVVQPNLTHAMVEVSGILYDHRGVSYSELPIEKITRDQLFEYAARAGWTHEEIHIDEAWASDIIQAAVSLLEHYEQV